MDTVSGGREYAGSQVAEKIWQPPRDSNPDTLLQRQMSYH
jgi:hypothetical protein